MSITAATSYGYKGLEKPALRDSRAFSVALPWDGTKAHTGPLNDPLFSPAQDPNTTAAETAGCKACGRHDCVNFACQSEREDENITQQKDTETLKLKPGEKTIQGRVESLISKGEVYKAVELLERNLAEKPTQALTDFADDILGYIQNRLPHEKTLQSTLQNAIGLGIDALNPEEQKSLPNNNALPELRKAA